jgi:phenylacetate-CoA ligase
VITADALALHREKLLGKLVEHCLAHSPDFRRRLEANGAKLPILTRRHLQQATDLLCEQIPSEHGKLSELRTSGSTGEPVVVRKTQHRDNAWSAMTMRFHEWHKTDFSQAMMSVRVYFDRVEFSPNWGPPINRHHVTGPCVAVPAATDASTIYSLACEHRIGDLLIFPTNLAALANYCRTTRQSLPDLKRIRTVSETLSDGLRATVQEVFGLPIIDMYSSNELGIIAIQCPASGLYHCMDDVLIVEVLNEASEPCKPGEIGRVVATDLMNYAMPIIRYDIGDYAEVGEPCRCGLPFSTLRRVLGRERNLALLPDGRRVWPSMGLYDARGVAPISQYQVIQHSLERLEVRLVVERALTADEENQIAGRIRQAIGHDFAVEFAYFEGRLPLGRGGKFEEFVSHMTSAQETFSK